MKKDESIILLPLGKNGKKCSAIIDISSSHLIKHKWNLSNTGYPYTYINGSPVMLHRAVIGKNPKHKVTDHINRNKLDNRRSNLRFVSQHINTMNVGISKNNKTGYKGVSLHKLHNGDIKYRACIWKLYKRIHIGVYDTPKEASLAYNRVALDLYGKDAYINE